MFKTVAARVDKRAFPHVTRQSVITELGIDSLSMMQIVGEMGPSSTSSSPTRTWWSW